VAETLKRRTQSAVELHVVEKHGRFERGEQHVQLAGHDRIAGQLQSRGRVALATSALLAADDFDQLSVAVRKEAEISEPPGGRLVDERQTTMQTGFPLAISHRTRIQCWALLCSGRMRPAYRGNDGLARKPSRQLH